MPQNDLHTVSGVHQYLQGTSFQANKVTPLSGGTGNFTFRIHLDVPYGKHETLIFKHAKPYVATNKDMAFNLIRQEFEVESLKRISDSLPKDSIVIVPEVHYFDKEQNAIIMDDCGVDSVALKQLMMESPPPLSLATSIGVGIGQFLGWLHSWGKENKSLLDFFERNTQGRTLSAFVTYGRLVSTLTGSDKATIFAGSAVPVLPHKLETIAKIASERMHAVNTSRETFVMGDFWPGNIMISLNTEADGSTPRIHVIDWELAKPGLAGLDVGQFCAEMGLICRFGSPSSKEAASASTNAFLETYRQKYQCDEGLARVAAVHIGAHLVAFTPCVKWGSKEEVEEAVVEGVEYLVEGFEGSESWLQKSLVGLLVTQF